jgi:DNA (cytosine-5)-methyltransferase 1
VHAAYYNEFDPLKAEILREAIKASVVAPGDVDERSITDVTPADLLGYTQCHFFAGGGFWNLALRQAGWPDDRPVWTGSCPCPSFSAAGKGLGFRDPRHLWPAWFRLIRECQPPVVFGEQVANAINHGWLDLVSTNLEGEGYAIGSIVLGAHSAGAPHIRQRLYFVGADTQHTERGAEQQEHGNAHGRNGLGRVRDACDIADASEIGRATEQMRIRGNGEGAEQAGAITEFGSGRASGLPYQPLSPRLEGHFGDVREWRGPGWLDPLTARSAAEAGATRGFWRDCDWWYGRDEKYRPIGPGLCPLVDGRSNHLVPFCDIGTLDAEIEKGTAEARVGRLRLYGDAICVPAATEFVLAYMELGKESSDS